MQRDHELTGAWTIDQLIGKKDRSITGVENLITHIKNTMIPALDRIAGTAAGKFKNVPKKAGKKPDKPNKPPSSAGDKQKQEYQDKLAKYQRKLADWQAAKDRRASQIQANKTGIKSAKGERSDLYNEIENLKAEKEGYRLDKIDLGATDTGGGGAQQPTIAEQTATANAARYDLFRTMASNFQPIAAAFGANAISSLGVKGPGGVAQAVATAASAGAQSAVQAVSGSGGSTAGGTAPQGTGGTTINQTNNYATAPTDPHTFSQNLAFELGAVG